MGWFKKKTEPVLEQPVESTFNPVVQPEIRFGVTPEILHRYDVILLAHPCCDNCVAFTNEEEVPSDPILVRVPMEMFKDLGSPIHLTMTLVPGDNLNKED